MAPLPSGRVFNAVAADDNGYLYSIGGTSDGGATTPTESLFRYDTTTDSWDTLSPLPQPLDSINATLVGKRIYVPGDSETADTFVYDIGTDSWSTIPANGGYTARSQYQALTVGTNVVVLGGIIASASASTTEVWILDTVSQTWSAGVPMQKSRTSFAAGVVNGEIVVAGGVLFPGFTPDMTTEIFDGTAWRYGANVPSGGGSYTRWSYAAAAVSGSKLWIAAGRRDADWLALDHTGWYQPATDTWSTTPDLPVLSQARVYMDGDVASDGYFYVTGGRNDAGTTAYATHERLFVRNEVPEIFADGFED